MGVAASFWQDEIADLAQMLAPPETAPEAPHAQVPAPQPSLAASAQPTNAPVQRISVDLPARKTGVSSEVARDRSESPGEAPALHKTAITPRDIANRGPSKEPAAEVVVPPLMPITLPASPPQDLKPRPTAATYYPSRVVRRRAAPQKKDVPILGPLFGFKY